MIESTIFGCKIAIVTIQLYKYLEHVQTSVHQAPNGS